MASGLPDRIIPIQSVDKGDHEKWYKGRSPMDIPSPSRIALVGMPNCGKTCYITNLILKQTPPFERIYVRHNDPGYAEFDRIGAELIDEIPENFEVLSIDPESKRKLKTVVIFDDLCCNSWPPEQRSLFMTLMEHGSTHHNISIMIGCHRITNIPPRVRSGLTFIVVFRPENHLDTRLFPDRLGMDSSTFQALLDKTCVAPHDSLAIDHTPGTPMRFRKNLVEPIDPDEVLGLKTKADEEPEPLLTKTKIKPLDLVKLNTIANQLIKKIGFALKVLEKK